MGRANSQGRIDSRALQIYPMVDALAPYGLKHTQSHTHTPPPQSRLRALDFGVQSGATACYLQTGGGRD